MRELTFSLYKSAYSTQSTEILQPWNEWVRNLSNFQIIPKKSSTSAFLPGSTQGRAHKKKHVEYIDALVMDIEGFSQKTIDLRLKALSKFEYFIYSTYRHTTQKPRYRLLAPLSAPLAPEAFPDAWNALQALTGFLNDRATKDISRIYYTPSKPSEEAPTFTYQNHGNWISLDDLKSYLHIPDPKCLFPQSLKSAQALLLGNAFATVGARHTTILSLTMHLAKKNQSLSDTYLENLFEASLAEMGVPDRIEEVKQAYEGAVEKIQESQPQRDTYSQEEIENLQERHPSLTWLVQQSGGGWLLTKKGYIGPFTRQDFKGAAFKYLALAPIDLYILTKSGHKERPLHQIVNEHGDYAETIFSELALQETYYEPQTRTLHEAVCPLRTSIKPKYHAGIAKWLELFGGDAYEKLIDWLSVAPDLTRPLCAIYFHGPRGTGKTQFAHALSKLWSLGGPADLAQVLSDFNDALMRCPIVFADEALPKKHKWDTITEDLRKLVGSNERPLLRKFMPASTIVGQIRVILAANNARLLDSVNISSKYDIEAIAQRFLYHETPKEASIYLESIPRTEKAQWWDHGFAEHVLWLSENHTIKKLGKRFDVEGDESEMHRLLVTGGYYTNIVCSWLVGYLNEPHKYHSLGHGMVRLDSDGTLLANAAAFLEHLDVYLPKANFRRDPDLRSYNEALKTLAISRKRPQRVWGSSRYRYHMIDPYPLIAWARDTNYGSIQKMYENLKMEIPKDEVEDLGECAEVLPLVEPENVLPWKKEQKRKKGND